MVDIAIIEPDPKILNRTKKWIHTHSGFSCSICESGIGKFFERLELSCPPDILIMDLFTKQTSNLEQLKKLKLLMPATKFLIHTEQIEEELLHQALRKGINGIKIKTFDAKAFLDTLHRLVKGEAYIDPALSKNIINLFRSEVVVENPAEAQLSQFSGLLNKREMEVIKGLSKGKQYKEIATDLFISINTVRHYVKSIYKKFEVNNKIQLLKKLQLMSTSALS